MVKLPTIEDSNQKIQIANQIKILWKDQNNALNNMEKLPKICAQHTLFELKYKVHKHGIITPSILYKTKWYQVTSNTMITATWCFKMKWGSSPRYVEKLECLYLNTICTTWNPHSLITIYSTNIFKRS
jgi:hypothetical protein